LVRFAHVVPARRETGRAPIIGPDTTNLDFFGLLGWTFPGGRRYNAARAENVVEK
jgi:hypothetical protein